MKKTEIKELRRVLEGAMVKALPVGDAAASKAVLKEIRAAAKEIVRKFSKQKAKKAVKKVVVKVAKRSRKKSVK